MFARDGEVSDFLFVNNLESEALGEEANWDISRVLSWRDSGMFTSVVVEDDFGFIFYASSFSITSSSFEAIVSGVLDSSELQLEDGSISGEFNWIGLVLTHPDMHLIGGATFALNTLFSKIGRNLVADAYSVDGYNLLLKYNFTLVQGSLRPTFFASIL